jgi:hypothetical protein
MAGLAEFELYLIRVHLRLVLASGQFYFGPSSSHSQTR